MNQPEIILVIAALIIRWPIAGFYVVLGLATLVEQEPLSTPILTDRLPVFYWPPTCRNRRITRSQHER